MAHRNTTFDARTETYRRLIGARTAEEPEEPEEPEEENEGAERPEPGPAARIGFDLLKDSRTILICEDVSFRLTRKIVSQLLWLDAISQDPIKLYINTPGGSADDGFAIHDMIRYVQSPVYAICTGLTASAGTIILLGAPKKRRLTLPNTRIMIHQPAGGARGRASDIEITAREIAKLRARANALIAQECGKTVEQVEQDTNRDYWMSPEEACEYGLCSRVITTAKEIEKG